MHVDDAFNTKSNHRTTARLMPGSQRHGSGDGAAPVIAGVVWSLLLAGCGSLTVYPDHQVVRARVIEVWPEQRMIDDWRETLMTLEDAPSLEIYAHQYRRVDIYAGRTLRSAHFESPVAPAAMHLSKGDVVEVDIGLKTRDAIKFDELSLVTRFACGESDRQCRSASSGLIVLGPVKY
jgi:hypothetical protein